MQSDKPFYLPAVDEKAQQEVIARIENVPQKIIAQFKPFVPMMKLADAAKAQETNSPQDAIINYLHAAVIFGNSRDSKVRSQCKDFVDRAVALAVHLPNEEQISTYFSAAAKLNCDAAFKGLGLLYWHKKKFDQAEAVLRMHNSPESYYLLGSMFATAFPRELKARAYYLAAGRLAEKPEDSIKSYADLANMYGVFAKALNEGGFSDRKALIRRINDAIKLFSLAACFGSQESMRSVIELSDYAQKEFNFSPSASLRFAAYQTLLLNNVSPVIRQSYNQFAAANNPEKIAPLPADFVKKSLDELDQGTQDDAKRYATLCVEAAHEDRQSQFELAESIFWTPNPLQSDLKKAIQLYIAALNGCNGNFDSQDFIVDRLKEIGDQSPQLRAELFFCILDTCSSNLFTDVFGGGLPQCFIGSIVEHIAQNELEKLRDYVQKGNPLACYVDAVIHYRQSQSMQRQTDERRQLLHRALALLQQADKGHIYMAQGLMHAIAVQFSKWCRESGNYEESFAYLSPYLTNPAGAMGLSTDFLREYALVCLENPSYLSRAIAPGMTKFFYEIKNDFRAVCCAKYAKICAMGNPQLLAEYAHNFAQLIFADAQLRSYFFNQCHGFIRDDVSNALQEYAAQGDVVACCELFLAGCIKNDLGLCNKMFTLIKEQKINQKAAIEYLKNNAQEKLQRFAATNMFAAYLFALVQGANADECKEKNAQWCSYARSAFDNAVHAHKGKYNCAKKIALIGCHLIDYYQQQGDLIRVAEIKAIIGQFCDGSLVSSLLINILNDPKISEKTAEIMSALLDELAVKKNLCALNFMGRAFVAGKTLPSGYSISAHAEKALMRLNELLILKPDDYESCYQVAQLLHAKGADNDQHECKRVIELLKKAMAGGIADAERLLLIVQCVDKRLSVQERNGLLDRLKKFAQAGDLEVNAILEISQKNSEAKERQKLFKTIDGLNSKSEKITAALSRLSELAKNDRELQWQLIDWNVQQKKLPSGYTFKQEPQATLNMLMDYIKKEGDNANSKAYKYLIHLLSLPHDVMVSEAAYALLCSRGTKSIASCSADELHALGYVCYETHRYKEALESLNAIRSAEPQISWLKAICYLHDEPTNEANYKLALNELTKALCIDWQGKLMLAEFPEAPFVIQKLNERFQLPRANALLARLIYVANFPMPKRQWPLDVELHDAAGVRHEDPCAQSLLAYFYRSGTHANKSLEQTVNILEQLFANPHLTEEIQKEAYDQLNHIVNEFLSMDGAICFADLISYLKAIYLLIPLLAPQDPVKAIECYRIAQANCMQIYKYDTSKMSMSRYEIFELERTSGSFKTLKGLAQCGNFAALNELMIGLFARYTAELKRNADNEKKIASGQTDLNVEQIKAELHDLVGLFINSVHDKKIIADLQTVSATRNVVDNLFDAVIEIMKATNEPVEKFCSLLQQAIEFNPKDENRVSELWNLICCEDGNIHLFPEKCLPILEQCADRNVVASIKLYYTYAPRWECPASQFVNKDLEKALKYLVQAARLGSEDAATSLKQASELTLDVDGFTIYGNHDQAHQAIGVLNYVKAKGYDGENKPRSRILTDLEEVLRHYKMPMVAMVAAMQYQKLYDDNKAYAMLIMLIRITHGLLPRVIVGDFVDVVKKFACSDDPEIRSFVEKIGNFLAATRVNLTSRKDFEEIIPKHGVAAILDDLVPRIPGLKVATKKV